MSRTAAKLQLLAALFAGMLLSGALIWDATGAAFSASTASPASNWAAGTVAISDDDGGAALFSATNVQPGDTGSKCILVTYTGNATASVRLHVQSLTGTLGPYVNVVLEQGAGGSSASCASFVPDTTAPAATMSALAAARPNWAAGFGSWSPTAAGQTKAYRISWSLAADNNAANKTAGLTLRWEAQA
ncbi:hypothetical protein [Spirilliplanes yamanashiensis]|uniref:hypothetical protein n=1 Tax=Spirilliplanes yamanashiensis TaxID=42233 RepID=UPI00194F2126|nr:hypothetical protein [Spirilliplanes yamanashiensis]MDP9820154.1 hypothetical protein [Spirilliplanes yamanashiensis]